MFILRKVNEKSVWNKVYEICEVETGYVLDFIIYNSGITELVYVMISYEHLEL